MKLLGYEFERIRESHVRDLESLEREGAIYADHWIDGLNDFRHVRIKLTQEEAAEYARSLWAYDLFLASDAKWARDVEGLPADVAERADSYVVTTVDGETHGPPWHCVAGFIGLHHEAVTCGFDKTRVLVLEEHGVAAFLTTIRRAIDALTPAIRCFNEREKGLLNWTIDREDDVRDLLFAMLRASVSDLTREEAIPSRAGTSKVCDLFSAVAETLIEIKWIGKRGNWKRVIEQVYIDIQSYGAHPQCRHLVFVIVDTVRDFPDPAKIQADLSGVQTIDSKSINVQVFIREP